MPTKKLPAKQLAHLVALRVRELDERKTGDHCTEWLASAEVLQALGLVVVVYDGVGVPGAWARLTAEGRGCADYDIASHGR